MIMSQTQVEKDQTGTERPVLVDQKEEHEIDFSNSSSSRRTSSRLAAEKRLQPIQQKIERDDPRIG